MISEVDLKDFDYINVETVKENDDGSCESTINMGPLATRYLLNFAFIGVLKTAIAEGKLLTPKE
jgi:hypothetical protein